MTEPTEGPTVIMPALHCFRSWAGVKHRPHTNGQVPKVTRCDGQPWPPKPQPPTED